MALSLDKLVRFFEDQLDLDDVAAGTELFSSGLLDSFSLVEVLMFIETEAGIKVPATDVNFDNLDSPERILAYSLSRGADVEVPAPAETASNAIVDGYSQVAEQYDGAANAESFWDGISRAATDAIDLGRGYRRIADVACGTGTALHQLAGRVGGDVALVGVEPSAGMRQRAEERTRELPSVDVVEGTFESLPLESKSVDYLYSHWAFHWTSDAEKAARELARVLTDDGELDLFFTGRSSGREFTPVISPIYSRYLGLNGLLESAKRRLALDADETRKLFEKHFDGTHLEVEDVYRTFHDTLDGHWGWWVRIEGHFADLADADRAACDDEVRAALSGLATDEGIPYTMHMVHVKLRRPARS